MAETTMPSANSKSAAVGTAVPEAAPDDIQTTSLRRLKVAAIVLPVVVFLLWGFASWHLHYDAARAEAGLKAELVREYAVRVLEGQRSLLDEAAGIVGEQDLSALSEAERRTLHEALRGLGSRFEHTVSIAAVDPSGSVVAASTHHPVDLDVSIREFWVDRNEIGEAPHVSRVDLRPHGIDALLLARRQPTSPDRIPGMVVAGSRIESLTNFFWRIAQRPGDAASIIRADGMLLLRNDASFPPTRLAEDQPIVKLIRRLDAGDYEAEAVTDGVRRIYAFTRIRDFPLFAIYGVAKEHVWDVWLRQTAIVGGFLAFLATLAVLLVRQAQRRLAAERRQTRIEFDKKLLMEAQEAAERNRILLEEAHHRIKNSLQLVSSFISLGRNEGADPDIVLLRVSERVRAISTVHDLLYETNMSGAEIDLVRVLERVTRSPGLVPTEPPIEIRFESRQSSAWIPASTAVSIALVVVELIINAGKHAFRGRERGTISVSADIGEDVISVSVADDGVGLPDGGEAQRSSGLRLVKAILRQLRGTLDQEDAAGVRLTLSIPRTP